MTQPKTAAGELLCGIKTCRKATAKDKLKRVLLFERVYYLCSECAKDLEDWVEEFLAGGFVPGSEEIKISKMDLTDKMSKTDLTEKAPWQVIPWLRELYYPSKGSKFPDFADKEYYYFPMVTTTSDSSGIPYVLQPVEHTNKK